MLEGGKRDWLSTAGNTGILLTLVLLAWQIRQANELTAGQMTHESLLGVRDMYLAQAGEDPAESIARAMDAPETLTLADHARLDAYAKAFAYQVIRSNVLQRMGFDVEGSAEDRAGIFVYSALPGRWGRAWWPENRTWIGSYDPRMAAIVDGILGYDHGELCAGLADAPEFCGAERVVEAAYARLRARLEATP